MDASLMECRMQTHYAQRIRLPEYEPKDWEAVKRCVFDLLNLGSMRADIGGILANVSRGPQEEVDLFVERCRTMYRTIEGDSLTTFVCRALNNGLPQRGREQVLAHFGSLEKIPSVEKLLEFLSTHKSVFDGERVKSTSWYYQRFKESPFRVMTSTQQIGFISSSKALSTTSPPTTTMRAKPSSPSQLFTKRNNSSMATIRTPGASRLAQQTGATCNRPSCVSENAKHSVDKCWSVTDPARFAQREARYQASLAQQRGTGGQSMVTKRQSANVSSVSSSRPTKKRRATQSGPDMGRKRTAAASAIEVAALSTQHSEEVLSQAEDEVSETLSRLSLPDSIPDHYMDHQGPVSLLDTPEEMEPLEEMEAPVVRGPPEEMEAMELRDEMTIHSDLVARGTLRGDLGLVEPALSGRECVVDTRSCLAPVLCFVLPTPDLDEDYIDEEEERPALVPDEVLEEEKDPAFIAARERMMAVLQPLLDENAAIDPKSHCPLPVATVELKVRENATIYQPPRNWFSHHQ
ncbi:hypothetical protein DFQ27_001025, partial [Actinomortierella ambigua]